MRSHASLIEMPAELTFYICDYLSFMDVVTLQGTTTGMFRDVVHSYMMHRGVNSAKLPLHTLVRAQRVDCIQHFVSHPSVKINARDQYGRAALHIASEAGFVSVVQALLQYPEVNKDMEDSHFHTPLSLAIWKKNLDVVELLLKEGAQHRKALGLAVKTGFLDLVKLLIRMDHIDVNETNEANFSPLLTAVKYGRSAVFRELLLRKDVNIELRERRNLWTPFLLAASRGQTSILLQLLSHGDVNVHASTREERTALSLAAEAGYLTIVLLLLRLGVNPHRVDRLGRTGMHYAVQHERIQVVEALLQEGCDCQLLDSIGTTPMRLAVKLKNNIMVEMMLRSSTFSDYPALLIAAAEYHNTWAAGKALVHVDPNIRHKGTVPLLLATKPAFVRFLLADPRTDVNQSDQFGKTALIYAVCNSSIMVIKDLLKRDGVNINHVDNDHQTAIDHAKNLEYSKTHTKGVILNLLYGYASKQRESGDLGDGQRCEASAQQG